MEKDIATRTKEDIYKVVIATTELAKTKTGALIVIERDIKIKDIISTGVEINGDVSPQLLVNIFLFLKLYKMTIQIFLTIVLFLK